jgi:hypothetical protein
MTGPKDRHGNTRPISVAELLAKNGTIGAPPVGGRRRRRRGNSDSVTVAELTGEIPVVSGHDVDEVEATGPVPATNGAGHVDEVEAEPAAEPELEPEGAEPEGAETEGAETEGAEDDYEDVDDDYSDAVADYSAHVEQREADSDPVDFFAPPPRRPQYTPGAGRFRAAASRGAEQMSPDPVDDDELFESPVGLVEPQEIEDEDTEAAVQAKGKDELPSYLRSTAGPLFGGQTVADDLARRRAPPGPESIDLEDEEDTATAPAAMSSFLRAAWVVGQCIIAVAFGAGMFVAFDLLWKWNNIVALVLSVLVILGLVVGVRVVRRTEDIGSTLIAVAVGALVTLGPLALLQSG